MEEKNLLQNEEVEIDLRRVVGAVLGKAWLIVLVSILGAAIALAVTMFLITPLYKSSAMFYVNNNNISVGSTSVSISSSDIVASKNLVDSYIVILKTRESLTDVIDYAGVDRSYSEMKDMITAASVNDTEIFQVEVTSPDPEEAERIASAIAYILPKRISSIIEGTSAKIVDSAVVPSKPSSPSYTKNTMIGFVLGFVLTVGLIALREIFDITIRTEDDVTQVCKHPVLAAVPDMASAGKGGKYEYSYDRSGQKKKKTTTTHGKQPILLGKDISFAASEAYKLLRTKLQFSFADETNNSRIIGLSSALSGEGKSLSAINLAYSLSQLDKKVILIDCDMRRPTLAEKLGVLKKPGLSNYLTGQSDLEGLLQYCNLPGDETAFHVITAGENPPNPIELLSSTRMQKVLNGLRKIYDYIILDLPPVGEVSDAMAVAKETDGMLLVVRQNYCNRPVLIDAVRQFEFIDSKILGVVYNCASENNGHYYKYRKGYYKKYYNRYGYGREYQKSAQQTDKK
jgi:capsular exopolysaccharide synthesis family protein